MNKHTDSYYADSILNMAEYPQLQDNIECDVCVVGAGFSGIVAGIIAPACPSCALSILSVMGVGGALAFLPFGGLELGFVAIIILIISLFYLSNKIMTKVCVVKK